MYNQYVREIKISEQDDSEKNIELLKNIEIVKESLTTMYNNLQFADSDLIDYYSYQIKASKAKLDYLIKQVKQKEISVDMVNNIKLIIEQTKAI